MLRSVILSLSCLFAFAVFSHEHHVAIIQIDYNPTSKIFEVSMKLFTNDLEDAIIKTGGPNLHLATDKEAADSEKYIAGYCSKKLSLFAGESTLKNNFIGYESGLHETMCYMEISAQNIELSEILVKCYLLCDVLPDQLNIVHFNMDGVEKRLNLNRNHSSERIALN